MISCFLSFTAQDGLSPLYSACQDGFTDIVNVLLQAGADVNQAYTKVSDTSYYHYVIPCVNICISRNRVEYLLV